LVRDGDLIELDVAGRGLALLVSDQELERRRSAWRPAADPPSGYLRLYSDHVMQADKGCDLDCLVGRRGAPIPRVYL
jgi:L-arabonate dehydrase